MKPGGDQWQVDDELLTETGRGGLFTNGYLGGAPLISYLDDGETPLFVFGSGKRGLTRDRDDETERVVPDSGYRAITAITDRRIQFVVGGGRADGDWAESVRLSDIDRVSVDTGLIRKQLSIDVSDGTTYRVYLKDVDTDRVVSFLEDVSWAWITVEELLDDARKSLVDASQHEKARAYDEAKAAITRARQILDEAADTTADLSSEASSGIHARIDQVEGRYRETKRRVHASRATHLVDEAERYWRDDEFERAYEQFSTAREEYCAILDIYGLDPDKADAMRDRIEHVDGNLDHLLTAPLRRANQAVKRASEATEAAEALAYWKTALELYRRVIELDWGREEKRFDGDIDLVRDRVVGVVDEILTARREVTDSRVERAEQLLAEDDYSAARLAFAEAMDHLEAAIELAREFDPDAVPDLEDRLSTLEDRVRNATRTVSEATEMDDAESAAEPSDSQTATETNYDDFDNWVTLADEEPDASEEAQPTGLDPIETDEGDTYPGDDTQFEDDTELVDDDQPLAADFQNVGSEDASERDGILGDSLVGDPDPEAWVVDAIETLDRLELLDLVEIVWTELGWSTSADDDQRGVVASREAPMSERTTIDVVSTGTTTESDISTLADRRDRTGADRAVLVTTVTVAPSAARRAIDADVELLDIEGFAGIVDREALTDTLPDATM
jgi:tetratricopeptide (TPR) repeat protein